ncbi:MAG: hypothetical protein ACKOAM_05315, partial [Chakrabartia sp.]
VKHMARQDGFGGPKSALIARAMLSTEPEVVAEARDVLRLAGGLDAIENRARALLLANPMLAARLADWAYFGAPEDPKALKLVIDVYLARIAEPDMPVQEGLIYLDMAAKARAKLAELEATQP